MDSFSQKIPKDDVMYSCRCVTLLQIRALFSKLKNQLKSRQRRLRRAVLDLELLYSCMGSKDTAQASLIHRDRMACLARVSTHVWVGH